MEEMCQVELNYRLQYQKMKKRCHLTVATFPPQEPFPETKFFKGVLSSALSISITGTVLVGR